MRIRFLAASIATLVAPASATAALPPALLTPTAPWNVEFADRMCLLSRPFGTTNLLLKPAMVGTDLELIVSRPVMSGGVYKSGRAGLTIAGKKIKSFSGFQAYNTANARLIRILVPEKTRLSSVRETLTIDVAEDGQHSFTLAGIDRAIPVLDACLAQLRAAYKVGEADVGVLASEPDLEEYGVINRADFPRDALKSGQFGTVGVLMWVESNGRVSKCEVIESNASPSLDRMTCKIMLERARFTPATNTARKAVRAPSFLRFPWDYFHMFAR